MAKTYTSLNEKDYELESKPLASGGEGKIYNLIGKDSDKVAKIYHEPDDPKKRGEWEQHLPTLRDKLLQMVKHSPFKKADKTLADNVAWPLDVFYDAKEHLCGFVMPKLSYIPLDETYYRSHELDITNRDKIQIAQNICAVTTHVHAAGYVIGDFNPKNIGVVSGTSLVAFVDTDSYQIGDDYRCVVCAEGYVAPELVQVAEKYKKANPKDKDKLFAKMPLPTFTQETDYFGLAIHIFKLLMNGYDPHDGSPHSPVGSLPTLSPNERVLAGNYVFKPGFKPRKKAAIPRFETFPMEIVDLFTRAFIGSREDSKQRPSAHEWYEALGRYEKELVDCPANSLHQYYSGNSECPYCEAEGRGASTKMQKPAPVVKVPRGTLRIGEPTEAAVWTANFSPDGMNIATASADGTIRIWDAVSEKELQQLKGHKGGVMSAAFSLDGKKIVTASRDETVRIWDAESGKELSKFAENIRFTSAAFSPDGKKVVATSHDNIALIWDVAAGKELRQLKGHASNVWSAAFSPNGKKIATASEDRTVRIWNAESGKEIQQLKGPSKDGAFYSVAFSPDGKKIATAGSDKTARIWDAESGKELKKFSGHTDGVWTVAFSPDGKKIVTTSWDNTAKVWEVASGKELKPLEGHKNTVRSASFSPDGEKVVTASWDGTARIWNLE